MSRGPWRRLDGRIALDALGISGKGVSPSLVTDDASETGAVITLSYARGRFASRSGNVLDAFDFLTPAQRVSVVGNDASEDVTESLQAALDAASGRILRLPAGTYIVGGTLRIASDTILRGAGRDSTVIRRILPLPGQTAVGPLVDGTDRVRLTLEGLSFDMGDEDPSPALLLRRTQGALVRRCRFRTQGPGVSADAGPGPVLGPEGILLEACLFDGPRTQASFLSATDVVLRACVFAPAPGGSPEAVVTFGLTCFSVVVDGCRFSGPNVSIEVGGGGQLTFGNCTFGGAGLRIFQPRGLAVLGCSLSGLVSILGAIDLQIRACSVAPFGLVEIGGATRVLLADCTFLDPASGLDVRDSEGVGLRNCSFGPSCSLAFAGMDDVVDVDGCVLPGGGVGSVRVRRMRLRNCRNADAAGPQADFISRGQLVSSSPAVPDSGSWQPGHLVLNTLPARGSPAAWFAPVGGVLGTYLEFLNASSDGTNRVLTLSGPTSVLASGMRISVGGLQRLVQSINPGASSLVPDATVPAGSNLPIAFVPPRSFPLSASLPAGQAEYTWQGVGNISPPGTITTSAPGSAFLLDGQGGNRIEFSAAGFSFPMIVLRSVGTRLLLNPRLTATTVDFAVGCSLTSLWFSVDAPSSSFRWYGPGGGQPWAQLAGNGNLVLSRRLRSQTLTASNDPGSVLTTKSYVDGVTASVRISLFVSVFDHLPGADVASLAAGTATNVDLQPALIAAAGRTLLLPRGVYVLSATAWVGPNTRIVGAGMGTVFRQATPFGSPAFSATPTAGSLEIRDVAVDANGGPVFLRAEAGRHLVVARCRFDNAPTALDFLNSSHILVRDCSFSMTSGADAVRLRGVTDLLIDGCHFALPVTGSGSGISLVRQCRRVAVRGCTFAFVPQAGGTAFAATGIQVAPANEDIVVSRCRFSTTFAIVFLGSGPLAMGSEIPVYARNLKIRDCIMLGSRCAVRKIAADVAFVRCHFQGLPAGPAGSQSAIHLTSETDANGLRHQVAHGSLHLDGCTFVNAGPLTVSLSFSVSRITIRGCRFVTTERWYQDRQALHARGLARSNESRADLVWMSDCTFDTGADAFLVSGGAQIGRFVVANCPGFSAPGSAMPPLFVPQYARSAVQPADEGTFEQGDIVWASEPAPGLPIGWVCVQSGTFGAAGGLASADGSETVALTGPFSLPHRGFVTVNGVTRRVVRQFATFSASSAVGDGTPNVVLSGAVGSLAPGDFVAVGPVRAAVVAANGSAVTLSQSVPVGTHSIALADRLTATCDGSTTVILSGPNPGQNLAVGNLVSIQGLRVRIVRTGSVFWDADRMLATSNGSQILTLPFAVAPSQLEVGTPVEVNGTRSRVADLAGTSLTLTSAIPPGTGLRITFPPYLIVSLPPPASTDQSILYDTSFAVLDGPVPLGSNLTVVSAGDPAFRPLAPINP